MTRTDVISALLDAGWRWECLGEGLKPVLTNAPVGTRQCPECLEWRKISDFRHIYPFSPCQPCISAMRREAWREQHWQGYVRRDWRQA